MEGSRAETQQGGGKTTHSVTIDPELEALFEALPDGGRHYGRHWTPEEDALLLKYWPIKNKVAMAKLLKVNRNTALERYRKLTEVQNGTA